MEAGCVMRGHTGTIRLALSFAALLGALTLVIWRQSHALETLRALDGLRDSRAIAEAERSDLLRRIERLESRAHVVAAARDRLGMRVPAANEIVILPLHEGHAAADRRIAALHGGQARGRL